MQQATTNFLRGADVLRSLIKPELFCGLATGGALCLAAQSWLALFGTGLSSALVGLFAVCAAVSLGIVIARARLENVFPYWSRWLCLSAWIGLLPFWGNLSEFGPGVFSTELLESMPLQLLAMLPAAIALLGLPSFLVTLSVWGRGTGTIFSLVWSLWCGAAISSSLLMLALDSQTMYWTLVALSLVAAGWCAWGTSAAPSQMLSIAFFSGRKQRNRSRRADLGTKTVLWMFPVVSGFLLAVVALVVRQWCPESVPVLMGQLLVGMSGILVAWALSGAHRLGRAIRRIPLTCWLLLPIIVAQLLILYEPGVTRLMLNLNTQWSSPYQLLAVRILVVSLFPLAVGATAGLWLRAAVGVTRTESASFCISSVCLAGLAWGTAAALLAAGYRLESLLIVPTAVGLIGGGLSFTPDRGRFHTTSTWGYRLSRLTVTALMGSVIVVAVRLPSDTGQLPARVLFSPVSAGQFRRGLEWRLVPFVDDARLMDEMSTANGMLTIYNYHGLETVVRRDGIPAGYLSHDYRLMPQFPSDALMIALPSVLHGEVRDVAICHWNCGVTVSSALEFPIETIDCFDADERLVDVTYGRQIDNPWAGLNPITDTRVRLHTVDPGLALRARTRTYDVIVSDPPRSMLAGAAEEMTKEFYRNAAERLSPGGLFCQRFLHYDQGAHAWADVLATLRSVYPQVMAIEMIPGETLFVASSTQDLSLVPDLEERLQKPQVRRVLARFGWDWGHVLQLPTVSSAGGGGLLAQVPGTVQSVLAPDLCQTHVPDALRWSDKWEEKTSAFAAYRTRLADLAGVEGNSGGIQRRMEEVVSQQHTMSDQVDLPWVYRSKLKEFLSLKPRSEIVQVKGQKPRQELHPVDKRRVEYLEALADAHKSKPLSSASIERLAGYETPFDPLISYFLHYEAAELYARLPDSDPQLEFQHRLKTIYFGDVRDKSVRNVVAALNLLLDHEQLVDSPQDRFDHIHGLIQFLLNRWQLRRGYSPRSSDEALVDIQDSLSAAERGLAALDHLVAETNYGVENWEARREYLELYLVSPLRSYRSELLPHFERTLRQRKAESAR